MGNSYVQVYLDTTPPTAILDYPTTTTMDSNEYITITSNEELAPNHEIVIVDSMNVSHFYTFSLQEDKKGFVGSISFRNFPKGIATLTVRLFDKVMNKSETFQGTINILDPQLQSLKIDVDDSINANIKLTTSIQRITLQEN
jgi:hypothetical protein